VPAPKPPPVKGVKSEIAPKVSFLVYQPAVAIDIVVRFLFLAVLSDTRVHFAVGLECQKGRQ